MSIESYYTESFSLHKRTETKVNGKLVRSWGSGVPYKGAFFTPATVRTVRYDKQDFVISKKLFSPIEDIELGDRITHDSTTYDVVFKSNGNGRDHHLEVGLVSR